MGFFSAFKKGRSGISATSSATNNETARGVMEMVRDTTGVAVPGMEANASCFPTMSYETRIQGFVLCFIMGWILSFCSVIAISMVNIPGFVLLYSFGNIISIFATLFLMGPMRQLKSMFAPVRVVATIVFIGMLIATIIVAIKTRNFVLVLICVILQFFAGLWYSLSYIPYAREMILSLCFNRGTI